MSTTSAEESKAKGAIAAEREALEEGHLLPQANRDDEYGEVLERVPAFLDELSNERDRNRAG